VDKLKALRALMDQHHLKSQDVAELLCVELITVQAWLSVGQTRPIPDRQLKLLKRLVEK
jgi:hypothetical protein